MSKKTILIANRGEIAIRLARACKEAGLGSVAVFSADDESSLHVRRADRAVALQGVGAAAYLNVDNIVAAAREAGCDAVHPGYGFLSESPALADACRDAGIHFIGPSAATLSLFGDKVAARAIARDCAVPVPRGTSGATSLEEAKAFYADLGSGRGMMIKAVSGGGGRGMRQVQKAEEIEEAYARCRSEAQAAFGRGDVYVEELIPNARHIEVQVLGDGRGGVTHFGERECSIQRRHQKVIEIAPSPTLSSAIRTSLVRSACRMAEHVKYLGLGTFEFLVAEDGSFVFIETNPRLQVEHTITEEVYGVDLVRAQISVCLGRSLAELGLRQSDVSEPRGYAIQLRVNMETMNPDGSANPAGGTITAYDPPSGPGVRVDGFGYVGYSTSSRFDSLLAKIIVHSTAPDFGAAVARAQRAIGETRIDGVNTNVPFLAALLEHPAVVRNEVTTHWLDSHARELVAKAASLSADGSYPTSRETAVSLNISPSLELWPGAEVVVAPMQGAVVAVNVAEGEQVAEGEVVAIIEAMKMEHLVTAVSSGQVRLVAVQPGQSLAQGQPIVVIDPVEGTAAISRQEEVADLEYIRPDLAEVFARHDLTFDAHRPDAVARRHKLGNLTARENVANLVDDGSFVEYGGLAIAAQRGRRPLKDLIHTTPADGVVTGIGTVNSDLFGHEKTSTAVVAYDYSVFAGTQGYFNHKKQDRMFHLAEKLKIPLVLFAEGGGGRPGDTDKANIKVASLDIPTFKQFGALSGHVPLVGIVNGRCFAGNAALLGCCDVIIATQNATLGMGGPAMIEGGGLGVFKPEEVGPAAVQATGGVVDILVENEGEATRTAKQYLAYFQGTLNHWSCADQRLLRHQVPENRVRAYNVRTVIETLADKSSVLELRSEYGRAMITALIRIEGRPLGLLANNPMHLGGAIDAEAADKAARFMQLCDAHGLPMLSLCDTPGFMVGPDVERTGHVRRASRLFVNSAKLTVPVFTVVLRKSYGLGALAMAGGNFGDTVGSVSWPTGEFGGMGLEGAVRLAYRNELAAISDPEERQREFQRRVDELYERGKAINVASVFEIDDVIDPAETRKWLLSGLNAANRQSISVRRNFIDTW